MMCIHMYIYIHSKTKVYVQCSFLTALYYNSHRIRNEEEEDQGVDGWMNK